jgi:hypothetical protein
LLALLLFFLFQKILTLCVRGGVVPAGGPAPLEVRLEQALDTARDLKAMSIKALDTARAAEQQQQEQQQQLEERLHALGDELARARRYT